MAQVGMPVCVRKPVLWDSIRIGRTPYMAKQDGRMRELWEGEERGGGVGLLYAQREPFPARPGLII